MSYLLQPVNHHLQENLKMLLIWNQLIINILEIIIKKNKSTNKEINKEWPNNYFKALKRVKDKCDYILVADEIVNDFLVKINFEY